jgi:hypothetical protein
MPEATSKTSKNRRWRVNRVPVPAAEVLAQTAKESRAPCIGTAFREAVTELRRIADVLERHAKDAR